MQHSPDALIQQAKDSGKQGRLQESRELLRSYLMYDNALLWLARFTEDLDEALIATELALSLAPENEVARRAVAAVREVRMQRHEEAGRPAEAITRRTGMSLRMARGIVWLFRGINRPIGEALDQGLITLNDLTWAARSAKDEQVRRAAATVVFHHVLGADEGFTSPVLTVVRGSRYSEHRERIALLLTGMLLAAALLLQLALFVLTALLLLRVIDQPTGWAVPVAIVIASILYALTRLAQRFVDQADQYQAGRYAEEHAIDALRQHLNGQWTLFRNFDWPDRRWGDVDLILVGPGGVWTFEVKAYSGQIRNRGDRWERRGRFGWRAISRHPGRQARRNAARLNQYLREKGIQHVRWVQPVILWAAGVDKLIEGTLKIHDPETPVWRLEEFEQHLSELWGSQHGLSPERIDEITQVLRETGESGQTA